MLAPAPTSSPTPTPSATSTPTTPAASKKAGAPRGAGFDAQAAALAPGGPTPGTAQNQANGATSTAAKKPAAGQSPFKAPTIPGLSAMAKTTPAPGPSVEAAKKAPPASDTKPASPTPAAAGGQEQDGKKPPKAMEAEGNGEIGIGHSGTYGFALKPGTDGVGGEVSYQAAGKAMPPLWWGPIGIAGAWSASIKGSATRKHDGGWEGEVGGELELKGTLKLGLPNILTANASLSLAAKVNGGKVGRSPAGDWSVDGLSSALVGKLTLSATLLDISDEINADPPEGWHWCGVKLFEWSPTGDIELLVGAMTSSGYTFSAGKDLDQISAAVDSLGSWTEALNPFSDGAVRRRIARGEHWGTSAVERIGMIKTLLSGACLVDDERAIIELLDVSSDKGDLAQVLEGVGKSTLVDKINDDATSKRQLSSYLRKLEDASGEELPGRFYREGTLAFPLDAAKGAVEQRDGAIWVKSRALLERARKTPALKKYYGKAFDDADCKADGAWFPIHKGTGAIAVRQTHTSALTLWFASRAAAESEVTDPAVQLGKVIAAAGR